MQEKPEKTSQKERAGKITAVDFSYSDAGSKEYHAEYTPKFEEDGEVRGLAESFGLGVFEQNGKFYLSTCNRGNPKEAFLIPENIAHRIVNNIHGDEDDLVAKLWGHGATKQGKQEVLEEILADENSRN